MIPGIGRTILPLVGFVSLLMLPSTARAQGNIFNPYGNSGYADYREFGNPIFPNNPALPGQSTVNREPIVTRPRPNSYQQYTQELDGSTGDAGSARRGTTSNLPYFQAYQQLNSQYNRVYRPNDTPENRRFEDRLKQRDAAYAKALEERDPVKRVRLLREIEQGSVDRTTSSSRPRSTTTPTSPRPNQPGTTARALSPSATTATPLPGQRRVPSSPPSTSGTTRRPSGMAPSNRAQTPLQAGSTPSPTPRRETFRTAPDPSTIIPPPQ